MIKGGSRICRETKFKKQEATDGGIRETVSWGMMHHVTENGPVTVRYKKSNKN